MGLEWAAKMGYKDEAELNLRLAEKHMPRGNKAQKVQRILTEVQRRLNNA